MPGRVADSTMLFRVLGGMIGSMFLWASIVKSLAIVDFSRVVAFLMPGFLRQMEFALPIAVLIVAWEAWLGARLLLARSTPSVRMGAAGTLMVFSVVLVVLWIRPAPRGCGCFGFAKSSFTPRGDALLGLARNVSLIVVLACMEWHPGRRRESAAAPQSASSQRARERCSCGQGFTLVEVLVTIAVVAVLLALAVGGLSRARRQGKVTVSLATHQQLASAIAMYGGQYREMFPYLGTPTDPTGPIRVGEYDLRDRVGGTSYFRANRQNWASLLVPDLWEARAAIEPQWAQEENRYSLFPEAVVTTNFFLAHACAASWEFWEDPLPTSDTAYLHGVALSAVHFPSLKGLILDIQEGLGVSDTPGSPITTRTAARVDGSAGVLDIGSSVTQGDGVVGRPYGAVPFRVLSTAHGMSGRDF